MENYQFPCSQQTKLINQQRPTPRLSACFRFFVWIESSMFQRNKMAMQIGYYSGLLELDAYGLKEQE